MDYESLGCESFGFLVFCIHAFQSAHIVKDLQICNVCGFLTKIIPRLPLMQRQATMEEYNMLEPWISHVCTQIMK
jgi:hypothetical protein